MNLFILILIPLLAALFVPILFKKIPRIHTGWFVLIVPLFLFIRYVTMLPKIQSGQSMTSSVSWIPSLHISFFNVLDGLSMLFTLLITGIGLLVVLYSIFYLDKTREQLHQFYVYLLLFMSAMLGVVQSDHVITLYFFWELTSISSFLLIGYWYKRDRSRFGALKSMMITMFGGLMMFGGFLLLSIELDTYSIREMIAQANSISIDGTLIFAMVLLLLGAFTKSAQFPFYIWLPDAMEAPTPVSAYLHSATMVKAGIYLVARFTPLFASSEVWIWIVTSIGLFTMLWASFFATKQTDLKGILAFSTVSQLGLIMSLLGAGAISYHVDDAASTIFKYAGFAAMFHLLNHATFKGSLFMIAGIIDHETGTRDIRKLGGLMSIMPLSFTVALIGSLSMAGLPPFSGFLSKEMFLSAMVSIQEFQLFSFDTWGVLFPIVAWIGSIFTFLYSIYFVMRTFTGKLQKDVLPKEAHEAPIGMLISPIVLALFVIVIFFIPNAFAKWVLNPAVAALQPFLYDTPEEVHVHISAWHGFNIEFWMTIGVIVFGLILYKTLPKWRLIYDRFPAGLNKTYDGLMNLLETGTNRLSNVYMTGYIRSYMIYMLIGMVLLVISTLFAKDAFQMDWSATSSVQLIEVILIVAVIASTVTIIFAKSRLTSIIALGAVGYSVALLFVIFKAPDLALTQLVIETISVALFLLAFYHLPKHVKRNNRIRFRIGNAIIAFLVGAMVTLLALSSYSQKMIPSIRSFYEETVYTEAGGKNIVNVILVDYRGFDTLFEITVLAIASLGILSMIKLRLARKRGESK